MRIFSLLFSILLLSSSIFAQQIEYNSSTILKNTQQSTGLYEIISGTKVQLQSGFKASGANGSYYHFKIGTGPYSTPSATYTTPLSDPTLRILDKNLVPGSSNGIINISPSGASQYIMPIFASPGTAGMQPDISVSYNSQAGNGLLGEGCSINGLSAIYRVGKSNYLDDSNSGVTNTFTDKFSLDGNRLMLTGGTYGFANSQYKTELNSFSDVTAYGTSGNGPQYFIVKTKDGKTVEYGNSTDSRFIGENNTSGTASIWMINKITDANGNYMIFRYRNQNGEIVIDKIEYTGNETAGLLPYNVIKFNYIERTDKRVSFNAGAKTNYTLLLSGIDVINEFTLVKQYTFAYTFDKNISRLYSITESDKQGNHYNPTILDWKINTVSQPIVEETIPDISLPLQPRPNQRLAGDFNGDGAVDILSFEDTRLQLFIKADNGSYTPSTLLTGLAIENRTNITIGDFNNDGRDGFIVNCKYYSGTLPNQTITHNFYYYKFNPNTNEIEMIGSPAIFTQTTDINAANGDPYVVIADFDGDNENESFILINNNLQTYNSTGFESGINPVLQQSGLGSYPVRIELGNFNGNSKTDFFCTYSNNASFVLEYNPATNIFETVFSTNIPNYTANNTYNVITDFNGDGLSDILSYSDDQPYGGAINSGAWHTWYSTGNSIFYFGKPSTTETSGPRTFSTPYTNQDISDEFYFSDYNGDGLIDLVKINSVPEINNPGGYALNYTYFTNLGNNVFNVTTIIKDGRIDWQIGGAGYYNSNKLQTTGCQAAICDYNADGKADIFLNSVSTINIAFLSFDDPGDASRVENIIDGVNHKTTFEYSSLIKSNAYVKDYTDSETIKALLIPMFIVSKYTVQTPEGPAETSYKYQNLLFHKDGKGMLGFEKQSSYDLYNGVRNENEMGILSNTVFPYNSLSKTYLTKFNSNDNDDILISQNEQTYSATRDANKIYFPKLLTAISKNYETQTQITTSVAVDQYDAYGNILSSQTLVQDMSNGNAIVKTTSGQNTYNYDFVTSKHILGVPSETVTTQARTGSTSVSNKSQFFYNTNGDLVKTVKNPVEAMHEVSVSEEYLNINACGLPEKIKTSVQGDAAISPIEENYVYDAKKRFIVEKQNVLGQSSFYEYNKAFGVITKSTDVTGLYTSSTYDGFGNLLTNTDVFGKTATISRSWSGNETDDPSNSIVTVTTSKPGNPSSKVWIDIVGREIQAQTMGLNGYVYTENQYDSHGRLWKQSLPHFSTETPVFTTYTYSDDMRTSSSTLNNITSTSQTSGRVTTLTNGAGQVKTSTIDASGVVLSATDQGGTITYTYNSRDQVTSIVNNQSTYTFQYHPKYAWKTQSVSPDAGTTTYTYNGLGQLKIQQDAKNNRLEFDYDNIGRVSKKRIYNAATQSTSEFVITYVASGNGINQVSSVANSSQNVTESYVYNNKQLPSTYTQVIQGKTLTSSYTYDDFGRPLVHNYPGGLAIMNIYNSNGYPVEVTNADTDYSYWAALNENALGQRTLAQLGNGLKIENTYDAQSHFLSSIKYYNLSATKFHMTFSFDAATGNLLSRSNVLKNLSETFIYDNVNRLTEAWTAQNGTVNYELLTNYDAHGNINNKSDLSSSNFVYDSQKKHALVQIPNYTGTSMSETQNVTYNGINKTATVSETISNGMGTTTYLTEFAYGFDDDRYVMRNYSNSAFNSQKFYHDSYEEDVNVLGNITKGTYYIHSVDGTVAIITRTYSGSSYTEQVYYPAFDHQGSVCGMLNTSGNMAEEYSYDAWGRRRNPNDWSYTGITNPTLTNRGYTGHEHLDRFELINMNGRMYDPYVGRFLSPDAIIQDAGNTQSLNAYSYCFNNPLKYTDPSGWAVNPGGGPVYGGPSNSSWMMSGGTRYYIDGLDVSGTNFNLFYAGLQNSGYENLESVSTGGFSTSSGNTVPGNVAASAKYIYFNSRIRTNFIQAITRINQGFSCRFYETEDNMYFLQWGERSGIGTFLGRQNDLSNDEAVLTSSLIQRYYGEGYYNTAQGGGGWWLTAADNTNNGIGGFGTGMSYLGGNFRINNNSGFSPKFYTRPNAAGKIFSGGFGIKIYNTTNWGKGIGYGSLGISVIIGGINVYNAIQEDGGAYGANTQMAVAQSSLGITGAWAGAEIGAAIGVWFGGVGAIPGAVIGGVIGGIVGGWGGSKLGETVVNNFSSY